MMMPPIANASEMIPSNWPLIGHLLKESSISKPTNAHPSGQHGYRGLDLKILYNLQNDLLVVFVTHTHMDHLKYFITTPLMDCIELNC
jgi:hypothetical protein